MKREEFERRLNEKYPTGTESTHANKWNNDRQEGAKWAFELLSLPPAEVATDKFRDVLNEVQRYIETNGGATESEMKAIWNSLSCAITESERRPQPTAEGAKAILLKHCKENKVFLTSNELHTILDAMTEFAAQQQPTAEGAEEILNKYVSSGVIHENNMIAAMHEFATLHVQRFAEKMVSEKCKKCKYRGLPDSINEALNSGDGVYRP